MEGESGQFNCQTCTISCLNPHRLSIFARVGSVYILFMKYYIYNCLMEVIIKLFNIHFFLEKVTDILPLVDYINIMTKKHIYRVDIL